jgi:uncharacterized surface protein with fasciclin (FAS1) repeats
MGMRWPKIRVVGAQIVPCAHHCSSHKSCVRNRPWIATVSAEKSIPTVLSSFATMVRLALFSLLVAAASAASSLEVQYLRALQMGGMNETEPPAGGETPPPMEETPMMGGNETEPPMETMGNETMTPMEGNETMVPGGESMSPNTTETMSPNATETSPPNATESMPPNATESMPPNATETSPPNSTETEAPMPEPEIDITTVFEVIANQSDLSNLTAAATLAGLTEALCISCNYTVFAPTDEAFGKLNPKLLNKLLTAPWILHLGQVLANHATTPEVGAVLAANVVDGSIPMLSGENVTVTIDGDAVTIASAGSPDDATVVETDLMADNGVIHKIDGVLLPSFVSTDLIGLANSTSLGGDFTSLFKYFEAIGGAALLGAIGEEGVTVFAPTDEAFAALGEETLANLSQSELTQILSNHVLRGVVPSVAIMDGQMVNSLGGLELTFAMVNGSIYVNDANITMPNVLANNGIVHAIDKVLLADSAPEPSPMATPEGAPVAAPTGGAAPSAPTKPKPPTGSVSSAVASSFAMAASLAAVLAFLV